MPLDQYLTAMSDRCGVCGHHAATQGHGDECVPTAPTSSAVDAAYPGFVRRLHAAVRPDGTVHACDMRRATEADAIPPRTLSGCWRRAKARGLLVEVGIERSDDHRGRNAGRPEPYYRLTTKESA